MEHEEVSLLYLELAGHLFAVEAGQVKTVRRKETIVPAQDGIPGLLGFLALGRGIIPVLDLGVCLGLPRPGQNPRGLLLVASPEVGDLAFRVDRVEGPTAAPWDRLNLLPEYLQGLQPRPLIWGMAWRGEALVPLLDLGQVLSDDRARALQETGRGLQGGRHGGDDGA